jgi:hypothetical protein
MKPWALVLAITLLLNNPAPAQEALDASGTPPGAAQEQERIARMAAEVARRGVGEKSRVRVKLKNKLEWKGYIRQINQDSFELQLDPGPLDDLVRNQTVKIAYADVQKIRGPRSRAANVGIAIGMTVVTIAILAGLVVLQLHRHCS